MSLKTRISAIALTVCMTLSALPNPAFAAESAEHASRINVQGERAASYIVIAEEFAAKEQNVKLVYHAKEQAGDILVDTQGDGYEEAYGREGYGIAVENGIIKVKAADTAGASYGLRDVLRQLESGGAVTDKEISSPAEKMRALFVDCGRKYFSVEWFETIIREMAWNGMNALYMSFSNDEGFRFLLDDMSVSFDDGEGNTVSYDHDFMKHLGENPPTLADSVFLTERNKDASDVAQGINSYDCEKYLTQSDMIKILSYAKAYGIRIIPEFNSPGHTGQLLWYFPEYRNIGIWGIGSNPCYALNLENQEAKNFMAALIQKYIDFFSENGCTDFCVGGDEFKAYATTNETIAEYVNKLVDYVESKGMTAYAWVDGQAGESGLLKKSAIVNDWKSGGAKAADYQVVNFNSDVLYYVLKSYNWTVDPKNVFETWNPLIFNGSHQVDPGSEAAKNVLGASVAIWCDDAGAKTSDAILTDMMTVLKSFGYRVWNYDPDAENTITYEDFIAGATDAAVLDEKDVLGAVDAMEQFPVLENQLKETGRNLEAAQTLAEQAKNKLKEAENRVSAAEQKAAVAKNQTDKLKAEAEICAARAEANKLEVEFALKNAEIAKLKAAAAAIEAQMFTLDGNSEDASAKETEAGNLETEAGRQQNIAKEKQNAQAGLDKAVEAKKAELALYASAAASVSVTVKNIRYRILDADQKTAAVIGTADRNLKKAVIQPAVQISGVTCQVTQIDAKAFKGLKKLRKVTIGKNIKKIEKEAFAGCVNLSGVNMKKAANITSIGKKAFRKINAKAKITVPAKKKEKYKRWLKKAGISQKAVVK